VRLDPVSQFTPRVALPAFALILHPIPRTATLNSEWDLPRTEAMMTTNPVEAAQRPARVWMTVGVAIVALSAVSLALSTWFILVVYGKVPGNVRGIAVVLTVFVGLEALVLWVVGLVAVVGVVLVWIGLGRLPDRKRMARQAELAAGREQNAHAERVRQIRDWENAYRDAHGGAEPPAGFMPPIASTSALAAGTANTFAILALVFGFLGGLIAIPFGFVALSQIRKTGQSGRGLAIAGIILAFVWIAAWGILTAVALSSGSDY
jgi:hypothetical protein